MAFDPYEDDGSESDPRIECRACGCVYDSVQMANCPRCSPAQGTCRTCQEESVPLLVVDDEGRGYCSQACADEPGRYEEDRIATKPDGVPVTMADVVGGCLR